MNIFELTNELRMLADTIEENGGELTPELEAAWESNQMAVTDKVDDYNKVIRHFSASEAAIDEEIKRLTLLKRTAQNAQRNIKARLADAMQAQGLNRLDGSMCKMSLRRTTSLEVDTQALLDEYAPEINDAVNCLPSFLKVKVEPSKTAIKEQFGDAGVLPVGCRYQENVSLIIR